MERLGLDITDPASIASAAAATTDVDLLVNNAGVLTGANLVTGDLDQILGSANTDMSAAYQGSKVDPADVVRAALDGVEAGRLEVVVDEWSAGVKASLARDPFEFYRASLAS